MHEAKKKIGNMARGGHNIKTAAELKKNGTYEKGKHAGRLEAPKADDIPSAPLDFDAEHIAVWNEVCGHLLTLGILANQDAHSIRVYCENWVMAGKAKAALDAEGLVIWVATKAGEVQRANPAFRIYQDCMRTLKPLIEQFGFTPRARMGIKVQPKEEKIDPAAEIAKRRAERSQIRPEA